MHKPIIILTRPLPTAWLESIADQVTLVVGDAVNGLDDSRVQAAMPTAEGLISLLSDRIGSDVLDKMPNLRIVSNMAAGVDNIDLQECAKRGLPVGNTPGILTNATADITFALILAATRNTALAAIDAREGRWATWSPTGWLGMELAGKTLGIIGLGKIGAAVAKRAEAFGMRILYTNRGESSPRAEGSSWVSVGMDQLFAESDIVSLHCPLTLQTTGLINHRTLSQMKRGAYLINTSRGKVVDQDALVEALRSGHLAGAGLDVTDPEPLPPSHALFTLPNCVILPHIGSATAETRQEMARMACLNLMAGLEGKDIPFRVV